MIFDIDYDSSCIFGIKGHFRLLDFIKVHDNRQVIYFRKTLAMYIMDLDFIFLVKGYSKVHLVK